MGVDCLEIEGKKWVRDYANDVTVPAEEMPLGSDRWKASEKARWDAMREMVKEIESRNAGGG